MLSLLIVDDEVIIADGLYQMLQEVFQDQLVVRRCYSFHEARRIMETYRVDILMTDIEMPDVSGLELHDWVRQRWPMIRVIYLTGYSEFDYARRALEQKAMAYILKSEGDPVIVKTIKQAIQAIKEESDFLLDRPAGEDSRLGRMKHLVYHVMHGGQVTEAQFAAELEGQQLALRIDRPVMFGYCYCEDQGFNIAQAMSVIERLANRRFALLLTQMTSRAFLLIAQVEREEDKPLLFGLLESAQMILEKQDDLMTVCLLEQPVEWRNLMQAGEALLEQLGRMSPDKGELIILHGEEMAAASLPETRAEWSESLDCLKRLNEYLLTGLRDLYIEEEKRLWEMTDYHHNSRNARAVASALVMSLLHCASNLTDGKRTSEQIARLRAMDTRHALRNMPEELHQLAMELFEIRGKNKNHQQRKLVSRVNDYIAEHMDGELSLVAIAEAVHFHPVYLSRIYKEMSGVSLSDYIAQQRLNTACMMLRTTTTQISSIAKFTGFSSSNYFSRWFRKHIGQTPQEYRDKANVPAKGKD